MKLRVQKLHDDAVAKAPRRGDAGVDLYAIEDVVLPSRALQMFQNTVLGIVGASQKSDAFELETVHVRTGIAIDIPEGHFGKVMEKSSVSGGSVSKNMPGGITIHAGVIDPSYTGEIIVCARNNGIRDVVIKAGQKVAQLVILPYEPVLEIQWLDTIDKDTERGSDGFGSTGDGIEE